MSCGILSISSDILVRVILQSRAAKVVCSSVKIHSKRRSNLGCFHTPVLVDTVLQFLITTPSGIYIDGTVGGGGHSEAILKRLDKDGKLIGIDRDEDAVAYCQSRFSLYTKQVQILHGELAEIDHLLTDVGIEQIDGLLLDLGVSSYQIDMPERGFSYLSDAPLDMRMDRSTGRTARDIVNNYPEQQLADIFFRYGEERYARKIAREIIKKRKKKPIERTKELSDMVRQVTPHRWQIKTLSRVWQALRVEVNNELEQLRIGLERIFPFLKSEGRIVVLSYESLTDRMVKRFFRGEEPSFSKKEIGIPNSLFSFRVLTRRVVRPTEKEINRNPRAKSAKLRAAEKI